MAKLEVNSDSELSTDEAEMVFNQAAEWIRSNRSLKLSTDQKLSLYGLFKQVGISFDQLIKCNVVM